MKYITTVLLLALPFSLTGNDKTKPLTIGKILPREDSKAKPDSRQFESAKPGAPAKPDARPRFPKHWGKPPAIQTRDMVKLPGKFGMGSSTLANWIRENLKRDAKEEKPGDNKPNPKPKPPVEPVPPIVPLPPAEVKEKINTYKTTQKSLQDGLRAEISKLGDKPTKEAIRKVVEKYRVDNKDVIEAQKEIGKDIQDWHKENRPVRQPRPEPSIEVREKIDILKSKKEELDAVKKTFHDKLKNSKDLTKDQRVEMIKEFKEQNADKHRAVKEAQKALQEKVREIKQTGDRRQ